MRGAGYDNSNAFDPTSSASLTALFVTSIGVFTVILSSYTFGLYDKDKAAWPYQISMVTSLSGLLAIAVGLYIAFAYD
jgi:hypothetical protein